MNILHYFLNYIVSHRVQLIRFIVIGLITFGISFVCFHLFYKVVHLDYRVAITLTYVITVASHFLLHRTFTFKAVGQKMVLNIWKYAFMMFVNYLNVVVIMWFLVDILKYTPYLGVFVSPAITALINFFMMKYFVFKSKQPAVVL